MVLYNLQKLLTSSYECFSDDYYKVIKKLKKAEETDLLSTDPETLLQEKRVIKGRSKKYRRSESNDETSTESDDGEECGSLLAYPKIPNQKGICCPQFAHFLFIKENVCPVLDRRLSLDNSQQERCVKHVVHYACNTHIIFF